jgi:hypothetical protein
MHGEKGERILTKGSEKSLITNKAMVNAGVRMGSMMDVGERNKEKAVRGAKVEKRFAIVCQAVKVYVKVPY